MRSRVVFKSFKFPANREDFYMNVKKVLKLSKIMFELDTFMN